MILVSTARDDTDRDHLVVFFDDEGTVDELAVRFDVDHPRYGAPWGDERE